MSTSPACRPARLPRLIDWSAQCIVKLEVTRIAVFTPATKTGSWNGGGGHGEPLTTRTKKYAVKNEPKSMISDAMKRNIPSTRASTRELWFAIGGPWWWSRVRRATLISPRPPPGRLDDDVLDRQPASLCSRATRSRRSQLDVCARERRDDDLVDPLVLDRLHRRGVRVGVRDLPVRVDALAAQLGQRPPQPPLGLRWCAYVGSLCGADDQEARRPARGALADRRAAARRRRSGSRRRGRSPGLRSASRSTTTCSTGMPPAASRIRSTTFRRSQPERSLRVRRDDRSR